jgi:hypothetical protein
VCECVRECLSVRGSGAGGLGSPGGEAAAAAAAAVAAAARAPALLAAQVWSARHFVRFTKSSSGRSHRERPPLGARPRRRRRPQRQAGPRGPAAGTQGPGTAVFAGEGLSPPRPRAPLEPRAGERRNGLRRGQEPGAPGAERGGRGGAGCGGRGGSAAREPEAETHRRERRERPAIVPIGLCIFAQVHLDLSPHVSCRAGMTVL